MEQHKLSVRSKPERAGFSLAEIIVAMSILFMGCFFLFRMFHAAIYYSGAISDEAIAGLIAQRRIEEIRGWAYALSGGRYNFNVGNWAALNGVSQDSSFPELTICTSTDWVSISSPCSSILQGKILSRSARCVKVEVSWDSGAGTKKIVLATIIGEPSRELSLIDVTPGSAPPINLGPYESVDFSAVARDGAGNEIQDITMHWYVNAIDANGTIEENDSTGFGLSASFSNYVVVIDGSKMPTEGTCKVYALARAGGKEVITYSDTITLND